MDKQEIALINISREDTAAYSQISFDLTWGEKKQTLWYRVAPEYGCYLCDDRADSFVVTFFTFAMEHNSDLRSCYPVSQKLWYQLTHHVIPQLAATSKGIGTEIDIIAETTSQPYPKGKAVGTGMSCGVDSFATLYEYTELCKIPEYKLTHLTHFNVGAHHGQTGSFDPKLQRELYEKDVEMVQSFCDQYGYPLIAVDSNLSEVLNSFFGHCSFGYTHTYRNVGVVLLLQKLFSRYYYSPALNLDHFVCKLQSDPAYGEKYLLPNFCTESTELYNSNRNWTRQDKLKHISQFEQSYDWLKVCAKSNVNCCKCVKCIRTLMGLESIGKTELYAKSFDPETVQKNKENLKTYMLCKMKNGDHFYAEIYEDAIRNGVEFSLKSRVYSSVYMLSRKLVPRKLFRSLKKRELNKTLHVDINEQFSAAHIARQKEMKKR